jgi:hypothetical protein
MSVAEFGKPQFNCMIMVVVVMMMMMMMMVMIMAVTQHLIADDGKFGNPSRAIIKNVQGNVASELSTGRRTLGNRGIFKLSSDH